MAMSDLKPKVKIHPFRVCTMKICNITLFMAKFAKFSSLKGMWVEEHDGDVRFKSGSGNMAILCTCNASSYNYRNSSVIMGLAMWQIPRSTEHIFS